MKRTFEGADSVRLTGDFIGPADGPPVILLHGGGQTRHAWKGTQATLASQGFFSIAYDARGHGESARSASGEYHFGAFADDLRVLVNGLARPAAIIGASLGGIAAAIAVAEKPYIDCTALVLVDVVPRLNSSGRERVLEFMAANADGFVSVAEASIAVANYLPHRRRAANLKELEKNLRLHENGRYHWHWDPAFLSNRTGDIEFLSRLEPELAAVSTPILLVRGQLSDVVTKTDAEAFQVAVPRVEIVEVAEAAHMVAGDKNDVFTAVVLRYLKRAFDEISL